MSIAKKLLDQHKTRVKFEYEGLLPPWAVTMIKDEIEQQQVKKLNIDDVSVSLPTKDEVSSEGYKIANNGRYNYRRVLRDQDHDIYYSGWMDCFDWISKGNKR